MNASFGPPRGFFSIAARIVKRWERNNETAFMTKV